MLARAAVCDLLRLWARCCDLDPRRLWCRALFVCWAAGNAEQIRRSKTPSRDAEGRDSTSVLSSVGEDVFVCAEKAASELNRANRR